MGFEVQIEENREKNYSKNIVFFDCFFSSILVGFGEGFGRCFETLFGNLGVHFPICANIFRFFAVLTTKIAKIYSLWWAGGAQGVFWRAYFGGTWLEKG